MDPAVFADEVQRLGETAGLGASGTSGRAVARALIHATTDTPASAEALG